MMNYWNYVDSLSVAIIICIIIYVVAAYIYESFMLTKIGTKLGMKDNWMAYVPFVRDYYTLKMISQPFWKIFFFGGTGILIACLISLFATLTMFSVFYLVFRILLFVYLLFICSVTFSELNELLWIIWSPFFNL